MRGQGHYADSGINQMVAAQMQHMSAQRMQHNPGMGHYPGRADSLPIDKEHQYMSSTAEGQWQLDRDGPKESNLIPSHMYKEGKGSDASRSSHQGPRLDKKLGLEKQAMNDPRAQTHQTDMALGYEEDALPQTFEGLEQKFIQDIMTLTREQQSAEDGENARHRERLSEINSQYQEKLLAVRARQATYREDFLRKESQARHEQYQQVKLNSYQSSAGPNDAHGVRMATSAAAVGDPPRAYGASSFDSYGERPGFVGGAQGRGYESHESHGQYPGGRAYNTGGRYF